ncbi:MAG: class I SAM-dependent methyltransferase [Elusimicrobiota bacterium]
MIKRLISGDRESVWGRSYKDLPIKSDYRAHDAAFELVKKRFGSAKSLKVLDIATGTGALARRISDNFPDWNLEINDFENEARFAGSKKYGVDLNSTFSGSFDPGGYDLVVAVEIIEHLENPWNFLREIRKLLRKGGALVLSTPNVDSTLDRLTYLIMGHPLYFGERGYTDSGGHITPIPDWLFRKIAQANGYSRVELSEAVDTAPHYGPLTSLKMALMMPFSGFYMRNKNDRSINVYLCD